jgi:hypothetical protein
MKDDIPTKFEIPRIYSFIVIPVLLAIVTCFGVGISFDIFEQYQGTKFPWRGDFVAPAFPLGALYFWFKYLFTARTVRLNANGSMDFSGPCNNVKLKPGTHVVIQEGLLFIDVIHSNGVITLSNLVNNLAGLKCALSELNPVHPKPIAPEAILESELKRHARKRVLLLGIALCAFIVHGSVLIVLYWPFV